MRVLLLGGSGQLGQALQVTLASNSEVLAPSSTTLSLTSLASLGSQIRQAAPDIIINAAAYTKVDEAEDRPDHAYLVNSAAPEAIAAAGAAINARVIHISTDFVFGGFGVMPYAPTSPTAPVNVYGQSKRAGEVAVLRAAPNALVIRTAWLHSGAGTNFIGTVVRTLLRGDSMRVVDDQVSAPTRALNLARAITLLCDKPDVRGILHCTDLGVASWYDVACCAYDVLKIDGLVSDSVGIEAVTSAEYPTRATRPRVSLLDTSASRKLIGWSAPHWREGVIRSTHEWIKVLHAA